MSRATPSPTPTSSTWSPTYPLVSPPPLLHSQLVPAYPGPVLRCRLDRTTFPARLWRAPRKPWVCAEGLGWLLYANVWKWQQKPIHHHLALPLSDWALLSRVSARRGAGPGRIPRAEGGRAGFGARGRGPAGVQRTRTGLVARRAGGPFWTLSRVPGAGEDGPESWLGTGVSQRAPRGTERPLPCALISRRSRRHCVARGRRRNHAVRAAEVSAWAGGRARGAGAVR